MTGEQLNEDKQIMVTNHIIHLEEQKYEYIRYLAYRPSILYKPKIFIDGNQWCALYGDNIQEGVAGFGDSPEKACLDFDREFVECLKENK